MPKRVIPLSDTQIKNFKATGKQSTLFDGGGLFLLITPTGSKFWRFRYTVAGKTQILSFGEYPATTLVMARKKREEARIKLADNIDPADERKKLDVKELSNEFESIAREWHGNKSPEWSPKYAKRVMFRLEHNLLHIIGKRNIDSLKSPELAKILQDIAKRSLETAHILKFILNQIFQYAVVMGKCENNPVLALKSILPSVNVTHMAAPVTPKEAAPLLRAIDDYAGYYYVQCALKLAPMLFVRIGELRSMEWNELDLDSATWNIPETKMKMKQPHIVPLPRQAVDILTSLKPVTGYSKYVFPGMRSPQKPMSDMAINSALRRMGFAKTEITGHGFRAMARTMLDEVLGYPPDIIEHQLAHAVRDPLGRAYNRTTKLPQRREMMQTWADYLDSLKIIPRPVA